VLNRLISTSNNRESSLTVNGESCLRDIQYDEQGGIINTARHTAGDIESPGIPSGRKRYTFLERLIIRYNNRAGQHLDENGRFRSRDRINLVRICPTNRCNARCWYCPRGHIHELGTGYMDFGLFKSIIDWCDANGVRKVAIAGWGEPTLHPNFIDMIRYCGERGVTARVSTNAIALTGEKAAALLDNSVVAVEFSMDGFTRNEYVKGKQVDRYDEAHANILRFLDLARARNSRVFLNIHFVDAGNVSFSNRLRFVKYWKSRLKGLNHSRVFTYEPNNWAGMSSSTERHNFIDSMLSRYQLRKPCFIMGGFYVLWDGSVFVCSKLPVASAVLGNINDTPIEELYKHPMFDQYFRASETGNFDLPGCRDCTLNTVRPLMYIKKNVTNFIASFIVRAKYKG
jgi:radical SAM protein with 4Fe4S-binding SPASM domain